MIRPVPFDRDPLFVVAHEAVDRPDWGRLVDDRPTAHSLAVGVLTDAVPACEDCAPVTFRTGIDGGREALLVRHSATCPWASVALPGAPR